MACETKHNVRFFFHLQLCVVCVAHDNYHTLHTNLIQTSHSTNKTSIIFVSEVCVTFLLAFEFCVISVYCVCSVIYYIFV